MARRLVADLAPTAGAGGVWTLLVSGNPHAKAFYLSVGFVEFGSVVTELGSARFHLGPQVKPLANSRLTRRKPGSSPGRYPTRLGGSRGVAGGGRCRRQPCGPSTLDIARPIGGDCPVTWVRLVPCRFGRVSLGGPRVDAAGGVRLWWWPWPPW
jgi:hypothetical protein